MNVAFSGTFFSIHKSFRSQTAFAVDPSPGVDIRAESVFLEDVERWDAGADPLGYWSSGKVLLKGQPTL
jgi:hypothetical protein